MAENLQYKPRRNVADGIVADAIGVDGTSIRHRITGKEALVVHLLACALARM